MLGWDANTFSSGSESAADLAAEPGPRVGRPPLAPARHGPAHDRPLAQQGHGRAGLLLAHHPGHEPQRVLVHAVQVRLLLQASRARTSARSTWPGASEADATSYIFDQFMNSSGHRANIMGKAWDVVAVGRLPGHRRHVHVDGPVRRTSAARHARADPEAHAQAHAASPPPSPTPDAAPTPTAPTSDAHAQADAPKPGRRQADARRPRPKPKAAHARRPRRRRRPTPVADAQPHRGPDDGPARHARSRPPPRSPPAERAAAAPSAAPFVPPGGLQIKDAPARGRARSSPSCRRSPPGSSADDGPRAGSGPQPPRLPYPGQPVRPAREAARPA